MLGKFESYQLAKRLYRATSSLQVKPFIRDHLQRACLSVVLNLAEGSAKHTAKERRRFYVISFASLREVQAILDLERVVGEPYDLADRLGGMLYKLTRA